MSRLYGAGGQAPPGPGTGGQSVVEPGVTYKQPVGTHSGPQKVPLLHGDEQSLPLM